MSWGGVSSGTLLGCENPPAQFGHSQASVLPSAQPPCLFSPTFFFLRHRASLVFGLGCPLGPVWSWTPRQWQGWQPCPPPLGWQAGRWGPSPSAPSIGFCVPYTCRDDRPEPLRDDFTPPPAGRADRRAESHSALLSPFRDGESVCTPPPARSPAPCGPARNLLSRPAGSNFAAASLVCCSPAPPPSRLAVRAGYHSARFFGKFVHRADVTLPRVGGPLPRAVPGRAPPYTPPCATPLLCFSASAAI